MAHTCSTGLLLGALCVSTACMRIYPDPELPDVVVEWYVDTCRDSTPDLSLTLVGLDSVLHREVIVPCEVGTHEFPDLPRERFEVEGSLLETDGTVFGRWRNMIDLRDGSDERTELYLGGGANLRVAWTFDMGASCESLGADTMAVDFLPVGLTQRARCDRTPYFGFPGSGTLSVRLRAESGGLTDDPQTVAASPETMPFMFGYGLVDVGTLTVTPCGNECPDPPEF